MTEERAKESRREEGVEGPVVSNTVQVGSVEIRRDRGEGRRVSGLGCFLRRRRLGRRVFGGGELRTMRVDRVQSHRRRWRSNPFGKCSQERPIRGTVASTMRRAAPSSGCARCGAGAGCSAMKYQSLWTTGAY